MSTIHELTAEQLLGAYRSRELSPVEALEAIFTRIDALEPSLHAFICRDPRARHLTGAPSRAGLAIQR